MVFQGWVCLVSVVVQITPGQPLAIIKDFIKRLIVRWTLNNTPFVSIVSKSFCSRVLLTLTILCSIAGNVIKVKLFRDSDQKLCT